MTKYKIEFSNSASKQLRHFYQIDKNLYEHLRNAIYSLEADPFQGKKLKGPFKGDYSLCVGNYRVIYTIHKTHLIVHIIDLGHRKEIYRG